MEESDSDDGVAEHQHHQDDVEQQYAHSAYDHYDKHSNDDHQHEHGYDHSQDLYDYYNDDSSDHNYYQEDYDHYDDECEFDEW